MASSQEEAAPFPSRYSLPQLAERPKMVVLDVDGTLLTSDHRVTDSTRQVLRRASEDGVQVMLATSRGPLALLEVLRQLEPLTQELFVASQGALIGRYDAAGELVIVRQRRAPLSSAHELVRRALDLGLSVNWFTGARWLVSHVDAMVEEEMAAVGAEPQVADLMAETDGPDKLMFISPPGRLEPLQQLTAGMPRGLSAQTSNPNFLEVTADGVDKGTAVRAVCEERGIASESVLAMGDGLNDLPLFEFAGATVAPRNARRRVLEAATYVTRSNDEDGVAHALRDLMGLE